MKYFILEPEVAGGLGSNTVIEHEQHPPIINRLQYVFDGWLGDELLESFPCFIASQALVDSLQTLDLTGVGFDQVEISKSETFEELYPHRTLPEFVWLKIKGIAGKDDFGLSEQHQLVVSERILTATRSRDLRHCTITSYEEP